MSYKNKNSSLTVLKVGTSKMNVVAGSVSGVGLISASKIVH